MRYKVPQDVQRADQILWFLTLKQVIILIIGSGVSYLLWTRLSKIYTLHELEIMFISLPAVLAVTLAFVKIKGLDLFVFFLRVAESAFFRAGRRRWIASGGDIFVSMTHEDLVNKTEHQQKRSEEKNFSRDKIKDLADILDNRQLYNE